MDVLQASSNTFYRDVTLADLKNFNERYPLNSRVVKGPDGTSHEEVHRAGTPDGRVPPWLYAPYLRKENEYLDKARAFADPPQAEVIADLIRYYQTDEVNFLFAGSSYALSGAIVGAILREFAASGQEIDRTSRHDQEAGDLMTAMHEVIGHGFGKLSDRLNGGAAPFLKEYSVKADLMALWNIWDPKLEKFELVSDQQNVARAMYDSEARVALTQLRRIPKGDTIEEDYQRDRQLIANFVADNTGAIEWFDRDGKTYVRVADYQKMRQGVGMLFTEVNADQGGGRLRGN